MASSSMMEVTGFDDLEAKLDNLGLRLRPGSQSKTPHEKLSLGQIRKQPMIQELEPPPPLHPKLRNFKKYISEGWYDSDEIFPDPVTATQTDMNNRVICFLNRYLEDEISNNILHRRVCGDFKMWDKAIWDRVHKEVRTKLFNVLRDNGVRVPRHVKVSDSLASLVRTNNRALVDENHIEGEDDTADPSEEDYAANLPELASADRSDVCPLLDKTSSDSNKKEEKLPEEPASARSQCVHFEEKQASVPSQENPTADLDDKPCVSISMGRCTDLRKNGDLDDERHEEERLAEPPDRQKIPADTRSTATPVSKDSAADKVSANPVQRRSKGIKRGFPTEAALDKDSVVDRVLVVPPDPPDLQRRRPSEGERSAKSPDDTTSPEDTLPADPVVCKDLVAGVALYDSPHGSKDHGEERTVKPPDKERRVVDAVTNDSDSRISRADHIFDEVSEGSFEKPLHNGFPLHSKVSCDENHTTFRHRDPARTPTDPPDGTGPQKQERKEEKTLPGEFALTGHCSLPSTGMTWTDRTERLTPPFPLTRALWSHFLRYSWNNYRLVERLVP
ncbi:uncharacterized protein CPUR_02551 [Claviceps purpurea 20.1]|uniref:Uncharacterized protein n=1 Tax=Claviceps purpurea (strain 20.1) TaxID=1111077 RepID=M1W055_CLAP2|nr:uncharacterized protein CPUR_02551 [Claviceps purpurea 20.1]